MHKRSLTRKTRRAANTLTPEGWLIVGTIVAAAALVWSSFVLGMST